MSTQDFAQLIKRMQVTPSADGFHTVQELCKSLGKTPVWVRTALREVIELGEWECQRVLRPDITGGHHSVPGYRPVQKKVLKKRKVSKKRRG
jgi:hypothetical protein